MYMKIDGINGNVTAKGYENWISIESMHFGVNRSIHTPVGSNRNRESGIPSISALEITKLIDQSSTNILQQILKGTAIPTVQIDLCTTQSTHQPYLQYKLSNVLISNRHIYHEQGQHRPLEVLKLHFTHVEERFTPYSTQHRPQSPIISGYDIQKATVS